MPKITEHLATANGKTLFSLEILPPLKGESIQSIFRAIEPLMEFKPPFIDVTYHRAEYVEMPHPNGGFQKKITRKRPGTVGICAAIMNRFQVDAVPHIICGGFSKEETEDALIDLQFLGIENVLALRGDAMKGETSFKPDPDGNQTSLELVEQIKDMNVGNFLHELSHNAAPTNFCIGVSGYPEKHFDAPNLSTDIGWLKRKIDAGAEYIVTQMFFDNAAYFKFVDKVRAAGITVPIIPGLKPLVTKRQLSALPRLFHIDIPEDLVNAVMAAKDDATAKEIGIEWCINQSKELMASGVPVLHYYSMSKSDSIKKIATELF
jgi:methylenetetrahydrofolate reductase (NADPH)